MTICEVGKLGLGEVVGVALRVTEMCSGEVRVVVRGDDRGVSWSEGNAMGVRG